MYKNEYSINVCDDYVSVSTEEIKPKDAIDELIIDLFSDVEHIYQRAESKLPLLTPVDQARVTQIVSGYLNDVNPQINRHAREIFQFVLPPKPITKELINSVENGPPESVYIFRNIGGMQTRK